MWKDTKLGTWNKVILGSALRSLHGGTEARQLTMASEGFLVRKRETEAKMSPSSEKV